MFQMNKETFLTRLKEKVKYFEDNSSLQRFGHVISISKTFLFKRLFWFVFLLACCVGAGAVLRGALSLYTQDAVSYSVETDYLEWDTPFPAITLCQFPSTEKSLKETLAKKNIPATYLKFATNVMYWSKTCNYCVNNCKMNKTCVNEIAPLVEELRSDCKDMLTDCWWNDEKFSCCERFLPIKTQFGTCFVFNSRQIGTEELEIVNRKIGLPVLTFSSTEYISVKVHSPDEILTVASDNMGLCGNLPLVTDFEVIMSAEQIVSDTSVRGIAQGSRDCLFLDERPVKPDPWPFSRYSFSGCVWYCKAKAQAELCNCTHHFMPRVDNLPVCDVQGLVCLHKNKDLLDKDECDCPMDCEEITYSVVHASCTRLSSSEAQHRGTQGRVRLGHLPSLRMRRHAIRDMLGFVVDFGGVIGVFFGASLLSFIEIIYIFCIRKSH